MPPGTDQRARVSRAVGVSAQATRPTLAVSTSSSGRGSELRDAGVGVLGCLDPGVSVTGGEAQVQIDSHGPSRPQLFLPQKAPRFLTRAVWGMRCWQLRS